MHLCEVCVVAKRLQVSLGVVRGPTQIGRACRDTDTVSVCRSDRLDAWAHGPSSREWRLRVGPAESNADLPRHSFLPYPFLPHMSNEQTYIMIKPDGVQRGLVGKIIQRFEDRGYQLVAMKLVQAGEDHLEKHYKDLKSKPFFPGLIKYMASGPVVAMVWQGKDVVKQGRALLGATNPLASAPGTIRGDFCIDVGRNICHGSDSVESAKAEIALWFGEQDATISYPRAVDQWIYE